MGLFFLAWLCTAAVLDALERRCPNWVIISGLGVAVFLLLPIPEIDFLNVDVSSRLIGLISAFLFLVAFYKFGMMGAGDVKFATVLGFWIGWENLLLVWILSCLMAIIHGFYARSNIKNIFVFSVSMEDGLSKDGGRFIPYITYLCIATIIVLGF